MPNLLKPFCFVLMPFGIKTDGNKNEINFDIVYNNYIKHAIIEAGLEPIRADEEQGGGFIHKPMFERLMYCDFAVADLSFANANVFYELGIRHALKPFTTVSISEKNTRLPFDTAALRTIHYDYKLGEILNVKDKITQLAERIKLNLNEQEAKQDSPIGEIIMGFKFPDLNYLQKDKNFFSEGVSSTKKLKEKLEELVIQWKKLDKENAKETITVNEKEKNKELQQKVLEDVKRIKEDVNTSLSYNYDLLFSLLSSFKSMNAFKEVTEMLKPLTEGNLKENNFLQEQLALAYNKIKEREKSEKILTALIKKYGTDPEANGLLGAVYKGMMDDNKDDEFMANQYCENAINAYIDGFEADPRYYYPGINALTLMYLNDKADERFHKFVPIVKYAIERQLTRKTRDYWTEASALELAALSFDKKEVEKYLARSLSCNPEKWMKESTEGNLKKIYEKSKKVSSEDINWLKELIEKLK